MLELNVLKKLNGSSGTIDLDVSFQINSGKFFAITGESGAGKTTLLKLIAGLILPDKGKIIFEGKYWEDTEKRIHLHPRERNIGFVFQDYALFPTMTVRENLLFGLKPGLPAAQDCG